MADELNLSDIATLGPEAINIIKEINKKQEDGEPIDPKTIEALKAINIVGDAIDSIMSGRQIDMAFYQRVSSDIIKKLQDNPSKNQKKKRVKRKRKLYFKDKE